MLAIDAASLQDSPTSRHSIRRRGGKDIVHANYSKKSIHLPGALGDGILDVQFGEDLKADSYIAFVKTVLQRYKKIGIMADNADTLTGTAMRDYISSTNGAVRMEHTLPPYSAAQPHRDTMEGDQGSHIQHILWISGEDEKRDNAHATQQRDSNSQAV